MLFLTWLIFTSENYLFFIIIKYNATIINKIMRGKFNNYQMKSFYNKICKSLGEISTKYLLKNAIIKWAKLNGFHIIINMHVQVSIKNKNNYNSLIISLSRSLSHHQKCATSLVSKICSLLQLHWMSTQTASEWAALIFIDWWLLALMSRVGGRARHSNNKNIVVRQDAS